LTIKSTINSQNVRGNDNSLFSGGFTCADMLRQNGFRGRIILFTHEGTLPYDRVSRSLLKSNKNLRLF
jgi:hypothetical protein